MVFQRIRHWLTPIIDPLALQPEASLQANTVGPSFKPAPTTPWGSQATPQLGQGKTFYGLKPYTAGDDTRLLDWSVYARTRHPHIRQYHDDADLTVWWTVLASPDWQWGHFWPIWQSAEEMMGQFALTCPKSTRFGLWWLALDQWFTLPARPGEATWQVMQPLWTGKAPARPLPWQPYPTTGNVIPEKAFRRDVWILLALPGDPRLEAFQHWPIHPSRFQIWLFVDPWWQRWSSAMAGLSIGPALAIDQPGTPPQWPDSPLIYRINTSTIAKNEYFRLV